MTPEQFKQARHELRLTGKELARALAEFSDKPDDLDSLHRSIRYWEAGANQVPAGIATLVARMLDEWRRALDIVDRLMRPAVESAAAKHGRDKDGQPREGEIVLVWYDTPEILREAAPDQPELTIGLHRALCRAAAALGAELGVPVVFKKMDLTAYRKWLRGGQNTQQARARWASGKNSGQPWRLAMKIAGRADGTPAAIGWVALELDH